MSSKEQLIGIEQINDAVNSLDKQTQQNAQIASQTHNVAVVTDEIAKLVVSNANAKEFNGKNEVKAKDVIKDARKEIVGNKSSVKSSSSYTKFETKTVTSKNDSDEWESF